MALGKRDYRIYANEINTKFVENFIKKRKFSRSYSSGWYDSGGGTVETAADDADADKYHAIFSGTKLATRHDKQLLHRYKGFKLYGTLLTFDDGGFYSDVTTRRLNALMQTIQCETDDVIKWWRTLMDNRAMFIRAMFTVLDVDVGGIVNLILQFCGPVNVPLRHYETRVKKKVRQPVFKPNQFVMRNSLSVVV